MKTVWGGANRAYGPCWVCTRGFWYGVDTVPSVPIDLAGRPVEELPERRQVRAQAPLCPECVGIVNRERAANGAPLIPADPYAVISTAETPPQVMEDYPVPQKIPAGSVGDYLVVNGQIIRTRTAAGLCPVAGLPLTIAALGEPEPHYTWTYEDGREEHLPWCHCVIAQNKQKEQGRING